MRPVPDRAADLQRRLDAEKAALAAVEARTAGSTEGPRADLTATEAMVASLDRIIDRCAEEKLAIDDEIRVARGRVTTLEGCAVALAQRVADARLDQEAAARIIESLRGKVSAERAKLAPVEQRHRREIERLERRIATVLAYHPEHRSQVLFDPTPGAGAEPSAPVRS